MDPNTPRKAQAPLWNTIGNKERAKVIGLVIIAVVPGGLVIPLCYAMYEVIRRSLAARPLRR